MINVELVEQGEQCLRRAFDGVVLRRQPERSPVPWQVGRHAVETFIER
jgi:hypothetical protein